ncbi:MAG: ferrous iron transport protein B [Acidobacteriota bacterium]|jgi:ferrous iron transport protein B
MSELEHPIHFPEPVMQEPPEAAVAWPALSELASATRGIVRGLRGGQEFISRMAALGFTVEAEVEIIQNLGHGAIIVAVRGTQVALGRGEAANVQVQVTPVQVQPIAPPGVIKVALAGQPNAGKSTVFNLLTGLSQHVGNWPGKTVEYKSGLYQHGDIVLRIVDLPGTYSLTANSLEERIARDYILTEKPDVVVDIVNASALERNLYLLCELLALPAPVVLGLNMMDVAEQQGFRVEPHVLEAALGLPVVPMVATKNKGVQELAQAVENIARQRCAYAPQRPEIRQDHKAVLAQLQQMVADHTPAPYPPNWVALKLLEGDGQVTQMMRERMSEADWAPVNEILKMHEDAILAIAGGRYEWIERMVRAAVTRPRAGQITLTERVDRVATHPVWGLMLLLGVLGIVFWLAYSVGAPLQRWLYEHLVLAAPGALRAALTGAPWWLTGLLANGIVAGAGIVITFLPILLVFFVALGLLEDIGYMARAAYITDRFMHWMGLHGKSFLPLCLGMGCNVPGVLCSRIIGQPRARLLTILLTPLVPCTARLAVLAVLTPLFFGSAAAWVSVGVIGLNLLLLLGVGFALHELVLGGEHVAFIMEMPLYHLPNPRTIGISVWQRILEFLKKAGGVIVVMSALVWLLSVLPQGKLETSYLANAGRFLAPFGAWMGLDWRMIVALLTSVVAKENTIATLGVLYQGNGLRTLAAEITPAAALAFLVIQVTFVPCMATVAAIRQETRSWKWTAFSVGLLLVISVTTGVVVYQVGRSL